MEWFIIELEAWFWVDTGGQCHICTEITLFLTLERLINEDL